MGLADELHEPGVYLVKSDRALFRIVTVDTGVLWLEDCLHPGRALMSVTSEDLRKKAGDKRPMWRSVKPVADA